VCAESTKLLDVAMIPIALYWLGLDGWCQGRLGSLMLGVASFWRLTSTLRVCVGWAVCHQPTCPSKLCWRLNALCVSDWVQGLLICVVCAWACTIMLTKVGEHYFYVETVLFISAATALCGGCGWPVARGVDGDCLCTGLQHVWTYWTCMGGQAACIVTSTGCAAEPSNTV
jgi:hypothetical protein